MLQDGWSVCDVEVWDVWSCARSASAAEVGVAHSRGKRAAAPRIARLGPEWRAVVAARRTEEPSEPARVYAWNMASGKVRELQVHPSTTNSTTVKLISYKHLVIAVGNKDRPVVWVRTRPCIPEGVPWC